MAAVVETDLRALFSYYGEDLDSQEGPNPDDFFGMICSFSSSLQVRFFRHCCEFTVLKFNQKAALEIHDANKKVPDLAQRKISSSSRANPEEVIYALSSFSLPWFTVAQAVKEQRDTSRNLLAPEGMHERSTSMGRGDLDGTIRMLREGHTWRSRVPRSITRASKIFLDGRPDPS